nr:ABC transporter substrate-binding protein [Actinomyces sp.]
MPTPSTPSHPSVPSSDPATTPSNAPEVTASDAAHVLAADDAPDAASASPGVSRRGLLVGGGLAAATAVAGGAWLTLRSTRGEGVSGLAEKLPLVIGGDICAAPLYAAYYQGYFDDANLNVTLARTQRTEDTKDAVGAGRYIGAPGIFFSWVEPIYNGLNARLTGGFHSGCLRTVVGKDSPVQSLADLRGRRIGVPSLSSSAFAYFSVGLSQAGINPDPASGDVTWATIDEDSLGTSLASGEVDAVMGSDPAALLPVFAGTARELANNDGEDFCCSVALNGDFVTRQPEQAKALTEAWFKGADYLAADSAHLREVAQIEVDNDYVAADVDVVEQVLGTYGWTASATSFRTAVEKGIEELKGTGFITADVPASALATTVFGDLGITR